MFTPLYDNGQIAQKTPQHDPVDKLLEVLMCALRGAPTVSEINTLVRPSPELWQAFGLQSCAEQSTVADTLDACTQENVEQFRTVNNQLLLQYGHTTSQFQTQACIILEMDLFGLPTGSTAEQAVKGYFPRKRPRCGHPLARVSNVPTNEVLGHWLFAGTMTRAAVVKATVLAVEQLFALTAATRAHILWRFDAGFGTDANINWLLGRHDQLLGKGFSGKRATKLARSVQQWTPASSADHAERDVGKILTPVRYGRRTTQWSV